MNEIEPHKTVEDNINIQMREEETNIFVLKATIAAIKSLRHRQNVDATIKRIIKQNLKSLAFLEGKGNPDLCGDYSVYYDKSDALTISVWGGPQNVSYDTRDIVYIWLSSTTILTWDHLLEQVTTKLEHHENLYYGFRKDITLLPLYLNYAKKINDTYNEYKNKINPTLDSLRELSPNKLTLKWLYTEIFDANIREEIR